MKMSNKEKVQKFIDLLESDGWTVYNDTLVCCKCHMNFHTGVAYCCYCGTLLEHKEDTHAAQRLEEMLKKSGILKEENHV